jgi:hypothetical protein
MQLKEQGEANDPRGATNSDREISTGNAQLNDSSRIVTASSINGTPLNSSAIVSPERPDRKTKSLTLMGEISKVKERDNMKKDKDLTDHVEVKQEEKKQKKKKRKKKKKTNETPEERYVVLFVVCIHMQYSHLICTDLGTS